MSGWLVRRFVQMVLVVFGVVTLAFIFAFLVPANPARMVAGPQASPAAVASIAHQLGLDRSTWSQYVSFLDRLVHGNLGTSFVLQGRSVASEIGRALPYTAFLAVGGVFWEIIIGIPAGVIAAYKPRSFFDRFATFGALFGLSAPPFWLPRVPLVDLPSQRRRLATDLVHDPPQLHPRCRRSGVLLTHCAHDHHAGPTFALH
jgi:ABC-type dipeptide/oligopeptide/nickel transport system permease component